LSFWHGEHELHGTAFPKDHSVRQGEVVDSKRLSSTMDLIREKQRRRAEEKIAKPFSFRPRIYLSSFGRVVIETQSGRGSGSASISAPAASRRVASELLASSESQALAASGSSAAQRRAMRLIRFERRFGSSS